MSFLNKILFQIAKPQSIIVLGNSRATASEAIYHALKSKFKVEKTLSKDKDEVLITESDLGNLKEIEFIKGMIRETEFPLTVITNVNDIPFDCEQFSGDAVNINSIKEVVKELPMNGHLILNCDDEALKDLKHKTKAKVILCGFGKGADFRASDVNISSAGVNFKINKEGSIVPFWLKKTYGKENIYAVLMAIAVANVKNLNLIETLQSLSDFQSINGKGKIIGGIRNSTIIDNSEGKSQLQTMEALEILRNLKNEKGKKIAILGDILGAGKYTISAHGKIGEKAYESCHTLFTIGARTKFVVNGAQAKGMLKENIYYFSNSLDAMEVIKEKVGEGDLVLVDGSMEIKMNEVVKNISA